MSANLRKILVKLKQKFNKDPKKTARIQKGPIKGFHWNLNITDSRYILGDYETSQTDLILSKLKGKTKFADIGANAGYFSLIAKSKFPEVEVFLFEPLPLNIEHLSQHFRDNGLENSYELKKVAIGEKSGEIEFSDSGNAAANTIMKESSMMQSSRKIKVPIETIDQNAKAFNWDEKTFLKIDIEGAEFMALKGAKEYLTNFHPEFILATHDCHVPGVEKDCLDFLTELGYQHELVKDDKITGQVDYLIY